MLADPVPRGAERVLARFGLITAAPPVFARARGRVGGAAAGGTALAATGLLEAARLAYGALPNGFYSLETMLCEGVFRACRVRFARRARCGSTRSRWGGCWVWTGRGGQDDRRKIRLLAEAGKAGDWIAAMARVCRGRAEQAAVCYVDGHVRAYQGTRRIAKTHVPRLKFPARPQWRPGCRCRRGPAAGGDGRTRASLAAELRG